MWMAWLDLYSPWLSFWKPISLCMLSPWRAARVSIKGLERVEKKWERWQVNITVYELTNVIILKKRQQLTSQRSLHCRSQRCLVWFPERDRTTSEWGPPAPKVRLPHVITLMQPQRITFRCWKILSSAALFIYTAINLMLCSYVPHQPHWKQWKDLHIQAWEWTQNLQYPQRQSLCLWSEIPLKKRKQKK